MPCIADWDLSMSKAHIDILQSARCGSYYIGSTINTEQRLKKHNSGQVRSTQPKRPWRLVYTEEYNTISGARKREYQIKSWKSREAIERLIK